MFTKIRNAIVGHAVHFPMAAKTDEEAQVRWGKVAMQIHEAFRALSENQKLHANEVLVIVDAFVALYEHRTTCNQEEYYLTNLIPTGKIEGTIEEVLGTVPAAIARTREYFFQRPDLNSTQAEVLTKNLVNILGKERFSVSIDTILAPWADTLTKMASGRFAALPAAAG